MGLITVTRCAPTSQSFALTCKLSFRLEVKKEMVVLVFLDLWPASVKTTWTL